MKWSLAIVALAVLVVAAVSRRLSGTPVTAAMVFVVIGVLVGPSVLGEVDPASNGGTVRTLAEATLAVVLFSRCVADPVGRAATRIRRSASTARIGLPLTIALGAGLGASCSTS